MGTYAFGGFVGGVCGGFFGGHGGWLRCVVVWCWKMKCLVMVGMEMWVSEQEMEMRECEISYSLLLERGCGEREELR